MSEINISNDIAKVIKKYSVEVDHAVKLAVNKVSRDTNKEITSHAKFTGNSSSGKYVMIKINGKVKRIYIKKGRGTGKYAQSFALKTTQDEFGSHERKWYVKRMYPLTHLLEYGHEWNINGKTGKTRAFPHVKYGEEYAKRELPKEIEKRLKKIK